MKIGLAQYNFTVGDFSGNLQKILAVMQEAEHAGCDLLAFPELALSGYTPEDLLLRDDFFTAVDAALATLTSHVKQMAVVIGCPLKKNHKVYNCAVVLHQQQQIACYAKQQLPNYDVFDEQRYFSAGETPCIFQLPQHALKIGLLICEDTWFPETAVATQQAGAEILLSIHASPFACDKEPRRQKAYQATCKAADLPMLATLLVGAQDDLCFDGGSRVLNASGECVIQAEFFEEQLMVVDTDVIASEAWRSRFSDQEPGSPRFARGDSIIPHIYSALVMGIRDYVHKNHFKGALLGLSGGIDSALTLMLAVDALGAENVTAVALPSRYTSELSMTALQEQAQLAGVELITMSIEDLFQASLDTLMPAFQGLAADKTEENLQARCRGILLMAMSNKTGKILLTTGNKSEMAMGYATLYGDMCGGFAALKDVYKTMIFKLARYRNTIQYQIPQVIIDRPPSAELAHDQKDEDSLPPYEILDEVLSRAIDQQQSIADIIAAGFDKEMVQRVIRMLYLNEYKRRQSPPGIKITRISFTRERRYPITCGKWY